MEKSKRILWIDMLNVFACMSVLLLHSTNSEIHHFSGHISFNWVLGLFTHSFFIWAVNVFFMLSGFTLIRMSLFNSGGVKNFFRKRLKRLLIPVITWNVIYMAIALAQQYKNGCSFDSSTAMFDKFCSFEYNGHMWFFVPLICLYLSIPFLAVFALNAKRSLLKFYILLSLFICAFSPLSPDFTVRSSIQDIFIFGSRFVVYAVAGYYLGNYDICYNTRKNIYRLGWFSAIVMLVGMALLSMYIPSHYNYLIAYTNIPCTILAYSVFVFFRYTEWHHVLEKLKMKPEQVTLMSSLSLGVYLIQNMFFKVCVHVDFLKDNMIVTFIVMYVSCILAVMLLKRIPIIRKIV